MYATTKNFDDFEISDVFQSTNAADLSSKIELCLSYIFYLREPVTILNDKRALNIIHFFACNSVNSQHLAKLLAADKAYIDIIVAILVYYLNELKRFLHSSVDSNEAYNQHFDFMNQLLLMLSNITNESKTFCYKLNDYHGTKALLDYLTDLNLVQDLIQFKGKDIIPLYGGNINEDIGYRFLLRILQIVHNVSVIADYRKKHFKDVNITSIIRSIIETIKQFEDARILAYITLTNIVNDNEIETLPDTKLALEDIIELIHSAAKCIYEDKNLVRIKIDIDIYEENEVLEDVCKLPGGWHIVGLLIALYRLAINDRIKDLIYETQATNFVLEKIILKGNNTEKEYAARLLWQLCFDSRIAKKVNEEKGLYEEITKLSELTALNSKRLRKYCQGIVWSINKVIQNELDLKAAAANTDYEDHLDSQLRQHSPAFNRPIFKSNTKNHIMISYNRHNRELCLRIKKELERHGHTVWIDVENIYGSSLEAMAKAVEYSKCVLMCVTEKYKQSPNCRAEAEYAFQLSMPIIPLIMQDDYSADGWLGLIIGSKIFVKFTKYSFEECMRRLLNEISAIEIQDSDSSCDDDSATSTISDHASQSKRNSLMRIDEKNEGFVDSWTNADVKSWLHKNGFHVDIIKLLQNFTGKHLITLNSIRVTSSDYFLNEISQHNTIDLYSVVTFLHEFEKLF